MDATQPPKDASRPSCRYFARGNCSRGDGCHFAHDTVTSISERPLCLFFLKGSCRNGEQCTFRHEAQAECGRANGVDPDSLSKGDTSTVERSHNGVKAVFGPGAQLVPESVAYIDAGPVSVSLEVPQLILSWKKPHCLFHLGFNDLDYAIEAAIEFKRDPRLYGVSRIISPLGAKHVRQNEGLKHTLTLKRVPDDFGDLEEDRELIDRVSAKWDGHFRAFETPDTINDKLETFFRQTLPECGEVSYMNFTETRDGARNVLVVQFNSFAGIRKVQERLPVVELHSSLKVTINNRLIYTAKHVVRGPVMIVLIEKYEEVENDIMMSGVSIHCTPIDKVRGTCVIKLSGPDRDEISRSKQALRRLFSGNIAMNERKILWHPHFQTPAGLQGINNIGFASGAFIYRDLDARCLRLYGPADVQALAMAALLGKLEELHDHRIELVIKAEEFPQDYNEILNHLVTVYGSSFVKTQCTLDKRQTIFRGLPDQIAAFKKYLERFQRIVSASDQGSTCPICWDIPETPVSLACGHTYCHDCLLSQVQADQYPIACNGTVPSPDGGENKLCAAPIALNTLRSTVGVGEAFEQILRRALITHLRTHPNDFKSCPTADCGHFFKPITDPAFDKAAVQSEDSLTTLFLCPSCYQSTCKACGTPSHPEISCTEALEWIKNGDKAFLKWKKANKVRDCPECKAPIVKNGGCNHLTCTVCGTHICWFCMESFKEADEVYEHMEGEHEDIGGEDGVEESSDEDDDGDEDDDEDENDDDEEDGDEDMDDDSDEDTVASGAEADLRGLIFDHYDQPPMRYPIDLNLPYHELDPHPTSAEDSDSDSSESDIDMSPIPGTETARNRRRREAREAQQQREDVEMTPVPEDWATVSDTDTDTDEELGDG